jgi:hypothetical protein
LCINIPSIAIYKAKLIVFVDFHIADAQLKDHEIDSLRKYKRKKKQRSKKIIKLKIVRIGPSVIFYGSGGPSVESFDDHLLGQEDCLSVKSFDDHLLGQGILQ